LRHNDISQQEFFEIYQT